MLDRNRGLDKKELRNLDLTACNKLVWYMLSELDNNMLGASYKLRLEMYNHSRVCNKEMYKCRLAYSRKVSSNLVLDNLELHKVCNSLGLYNLNLLEELNSLE